MAVHPQFKKQKIGWNLLKEAERSSKQNGISRMYLSTTPFLMEAIHLYENFRFLKTSHPPLNCITHHYLQRKEMRLDNFRVAIGLYPKLTHKMQKLM